MAVPCTYGAQDINFISKFRAKDEKFVRIAKKVTGLILLLKDSGTVILSIINLSLDIGVLLGD